MKLDSKEQNIWLTADTHYWHTNITYGVSVWKNKETGTRRFDTVQEMSRHIVDQINKYVGQDDLLIHGGDWSFGGAQNIWNFRKQIVCKNIILIPGNHDTHISKNMILPNVKRSSLYSSVLIDGKCIGGDYMDYVEAQSLFTSVHDQLRLTIDGIEIIISHYPFESWRERVHFHGHTHSNLPIKEHRLDIGIDNAFKLYKEYKPFSWSEAKKQVKI